MTTKEAPQEQDGKAPLPMPLGPLMADVKGLSLDEQDRSLLLEPCIGGVVLFTRNFESREQLAELVASIKRLRTPALIVSVDHEGGRVQRFTEGFTRLPALARLGERYEQSAADGRALARDHGFVLAAELLALGLDLSFAPVLDLRNDASRIIAERGFHELPGPTVALARAHIDGMAAAGMVSTGKHFPGHGTVVEDSHLELPVDARPLDSLRAADLRVFAELARGGVQAMMLAHVIYPAVDERPAGFSSRWIKDILRGELGFAGVVISDDLSMAAALGEGGPAQRVEAAFAAGCDIALICNEPAAALEAARFVWPRMEGGARARAHEAMSALAGASKWSSWPELQADGEYRRAREALSALRS